MIYIIVALIFYSAAIMFMTSSARHMDSILVAAVVNLISAVLPVLLVIPFLVKKTALQTPFGIYMAVFAGVCIAIFGIALSKSFAVNKVGIVTPVVYGGAILLTTVMSVFIFKEKISQLQMLGLLFLVIGLGIVIYARAYAK